MSDPPLTLSPDVPPEPAGAALGLVRSAAVYTIANFSVRGLNFLLIPLYTRFLSPVDYGIVSLSETIAAILAVLFAFGLDGAMQRLYFQYVHQADLLASYVGTMLRFAAAIVLVGLALTLVTGPVIVRWVAPSFPVAFYPYIALAVSTAAAMRFVEYRLGLYRLQSRPGSFAALTIASFLTTAAAIVFFVVVMHLGAYGMLLGKLLAALVLAAIAVVLLREWLFARWDFTYVRVTIPLAMPLIAHEFMAFGLIAADRLVLQRYRDLREVGLYSVAYTLGMVMALVTASMMQAWSPFFFDQARRGEGAGALLGRMSSALALLFCGAAIFGALIAEDFVRLVMDPRYLAAGRVVPWVIGGYLFHAYFALFLFSALQAKRADYVWRASIVAFATNLALNLLLVPMWGMYGAALATLLAYGAEAALMYVLARKVFPLRYNWTQMIAGLVLFFLVLLGTHHRWPEGARIPVYAAMLVVSFAILGALGRREVAQVIRIVIPRRGTVT